MQIVCLKMLILEDIIQIGFLKELSYCYVFRVRYLYHLKPLVRIL